MTEDFRIEIHDHIVRVIFNRQTVITPDIVIRAIDRENELHEIEGRYDLWDYQGCSPSEDFGYDAVTRIIEHITNRYGDVWSIKSALLVDETIQFGLSRMFQILFDGFPTHIGIFQDEAAAIEWLTPDAQLQKDIPCPQF